MTLSEFDDAGVTPGLQLLPPAMDTKDARVLLFAYALQESELRYRFQIVQGKPGAKGPAKSHYQFEKGTVASRGGVTGIMLHEASRYWLYKACEARAVKFTADAIWRAIEDDDVLATVCARLLIFTDPKRLPAMTDRAGAWALYMRTWRPGKPKPKVFPNNHLQALSYVQTCGGPA